MPTKKKEDGKSINSWHQKYYKKLYDTFLFVYFLILKFTIWMLH